MLLFDKLKFKHDSRALKFEQKTFGIKNLP